MENDNETAIQSALRKEINSRQATTLPDIGDESFDALILDEVLREPNRLRWGGVQPCALSGLWDSLALCEDSWLT